MVKKVYINKMKTSIIVKGYDTSTYCNLLKVRPSKLLNGEKRRIQSILCFFLINKVNKYKRNKFNPFLRDKSSLKI